jgi:hypothetical protein
MAIIESCVIRGCFCYRWSSSLSLLPCLRLRAGRCNGVVFGYDAAVKMVSSMLVALVGLAGAGEPFQRYQVILDRAPFGVAAAPTQAVTTLKNLRLSMLMRMPDGPRAGFVDGQGKNDFVLRVNEKSDSDVELLNVDFAKEQVVIRREGQMLVLGLQAGDAAVLAAASPMVSFGHLPSALHPGPPPLPQNLPAELRTILGPPAHEPSPYSPEGRRWELQKFQLLNPTLPPDADKIALPMPGGISQPQSVPTELLPPADRPMPADPQRPSRHGAFGR